MTSTLKTVHDNETGAPKRIKYDGENVYASFTFQEAANDGGKQITTATLDCLGSYEIDDMDTLAYVDLEELREVYNAVRQVRFIDEVRTPFAEELEGSEND